MKINKLYTMLICLVVMGSLLAVWQERTKARQTNDPVALSLRSEKLEYNLGEVVELSFQVENRSDHPLEIEKPSVLTGNVKLFVSSDGTTYVEYVGPNWGRLDSLERNIKLPPGQSVPVNASVLFNHPVPHEHLTELYSKKIKRERLNSEFAFTDAGRYWLKAVYEAGKIAIESEPVTVDLSEPVGAEGSVWDRIKSDGAYAYFLQTGDVKYYPGSEAADKFRDDVRRLSNENPNSGVAKQIGERLVDHEKHLEDVRRLKLEKVNGN